MAADKTISQLPAGAIINLTDLGVYVQGGVTESYQFQLLYNLLLSTFPVGSKVSFGTVVPQNTSGLNTDVFFKTDTNTFYQKLAGAWTLVYTLPVNIPDGTLLFATGIPANGTGNNGDSYINTLTGIFYKKTGGVWAQAFSMATGPQGPQGTAGTNGTNGTNGNTILNGTSNPINTNGANGDFYINTSSLFIFGPKAAGVWPVGVSIIYGPAVPIVTAITATVTATPLTIAYAGMVNPSYIARRSDNTIDNNLQVQDTGSSMVVTGADDGAGHFLDSYTFIIKP